VPPATGGGGDGPSMSPALLIILHNLCRQDMLKESLVFLYVLLLIDKMRHSSCVFQEAVVLPLQVSFDVETDE
jgi:hypothetical protein